MAFHIYEEPGLPPSLPAFLGRLTFALAQLVLFVFSFLFSGTRSTPTTCSS
jgi:hypothetical protein